MRNYRNKPTGPEPVILEPFEVTIQEVDGDISRLIKKFTKKVRKSEILKPLYSRYMYHQTRGQRNRAKHLKAIYENKKRLFDENEE